MSTAGETPARVRVLPMLTMALPRPPGTSCAARERASANHPQGAHRLSGCASVMRATAAFAALVVLVASTSAFAQDIPTTTEFGITITSDNLTDAIQETQDFWGP